MNKTITALGIAAAMAAGSAQAVTFQVNDATQFSVYGNIQAAYADIDGGAESTTDTFDNGTTIGFAVEHAWDNGMTGFLKIEEDGFDAVDGGETMNNTDEAYFGVKGDFGSVQFGRDDSLFDDYIQDYFDYQETFTLTDPGQENTERGLKYVSNEVNGFTFGASAGLIGDNDQTLGANTPDVNGDEPSSASLAAMARYAVGDLGFTVAYDQRANQVFNSNNYADNGIMGAAVDYQLQNLLLVGGYQLDQREDDEGGDLAIYGVTAKYSVGNVGLNATVQEVDPDAAGADSRTEVGLAALYNISSNMYVYAEQTLRDRDEDAGDTFAVGGTYFF